MPQFRADRAYGRAVSSRRLPAVLLILALLAGCAQELPDELRAADPAGRPRPVSVITPLPAPTEPAVIPLLPTASPSFLPPPAPPSATPPKPPAPPKPPPPKSPADPDCSKLRCVALTMDDGPVPGTANVLDLLKRKGVHVTFFVVGEMARLRPALLRRMVREGHVVGSHSWSHPEFFGAKLKMVRGQLIRTDRVLRRATGRDPVLMRPPFGEVTGKLLRTSRELGEAIVLWNLDPLDWKDRKVSTVVKRVVKRAKRGSIILTHDSLKTTRKAYPRIIDGLHKRGFTLVTVPQLFGHKLTPGRVYVHD